MAIDLADLYQKAQGAVAHENPLRRDGSISEGGSAVAGSSAGTARAAMEGHVLDGRDLLLAHLEAVGLWDDAR